MDLLVHVRQNYSKLYTTKLFGDAPVAAAGAGATGATIPVPNIKARFKAMPFPSPAANIGTVTPVIPTAVIPPYNIGIRVGALEIKALDASAPPETPTLDPI